MSDARSWECYDLSEMTFPITYRYHLGGPWGLTTQELTVDAPALAGNEDAIKNYGPLLWATTVAYATVSDTRPYFIEGVAWKLGPVPLVSTNLPPGGHLGGASASRASSGCLMMHTGHVDRLALRRIPLAGMPASWAQDGLLTTAGMQGIEDLAQAMLMGLLGHVLGAPAWWFIAYPRLVDTSGLNPTGVAFRRMQYCRIPQHTITPPEPSTEMWP